jgi:hypothetical protein
MPSSHSPAGLVVAFDDDHAVANAGLLLPATLAERLDIEAVIDELVDLGDRPGAHRPGRKVLTLIHALIAGGDCISDADLLRTGSTAAVLGHRVMAPSTLGTFLRSFTFGHIRQLDRAAEHALTQAWAAGAGPGQQPMTIDVDSTICEVHGHHKGGAAYGYTGVLGYHPLLATRADTGEVLHARQSCAVPGLLVPRPPCGRTGATTPSSPTATAARSTWTPTTAATPCMNWPFVTSRTAPGCATAPLVCSWPTRPGWSSHPGPQPAALGRHHRAGHQRPAGRQDPTAPPAHAARPADPLGPPAPAAPANQLAVGLPVPQRIGPPPSSPPARLTVEQLPPTIETASRPRVSSPDRPTDTPAPAHRSWPRPLRHSQR